MVEAAGWMKRNQHADGTYLYLYFADTDTVPVEYNEVRHAGVTMSLYQAAGRLGDAESLTAADRGLEWMQGHLVRRDGWAALDWPGGERKVGATALMAAGLAAGRDGDESRRPDASTVLRAMQHGRRGLHLLRRGGTRPYISTIERSGR
jgi:hypothetical protein